MKRILLVLVTLFLFGFGCASSTPEPAVSNAQADQLVMLPTVLNGQESEQDLEIGIFYYPWYQNPETDGRWWHWDGFGSPAYAPPENIQSDYYPLLGAYSSFDPAVVDQHFAWIKDANIDVVISSWWGIDSPEDAAVPLILETAEKYDLKVAFHIEPYTGRTADSLVDDVAYINQTYGSHPAFYRTSQTSRWNRSAQNQGLFFVWLIRAPDFESEPVEPDYWLNAVDAIHQSPSGGMVIANATESRWLDGGHFDGLYNYATVQSADDNTFQWSESLPIDAWYVPSVLPGFVGERSNIELALPRLAGQTYRDQWSAAIQTPVEPFMLTITSFNEWHEGTSIEPAADTSPAGTDIIYKTYSSLGQMGYLDLTAELVEQAQQTTWPSPSPIRLHLSTTSDWTTFRLVLGGQLIRPTFVSISEQAQISPGEDSRQLLVQPLDLSQQGNEASVELEFHLVNIQDTVTFEIERGGSGETTAELWNLIDPVNPILLENIMWDGVTDGDKNAFQFEVDGSLFSQNR